VGKEGERARALIGTVKPVSDNESYTSRVKENVVKNGKDQRENFDQEC